MPSFTAPSFTALVKTFIVVVNNETVAIRRTSRILKEFTDNRVMAGRPDLGPGQSTLASDLSSPSEHLERYTFKKISRRWLKVET